MIAQPDNSSINILRKKKFGLNGCRVRKPISVTELYRLFYFFICHKTCWMLWSNRSLWPFSAASQFIGFFCFFHREEMNDLDAKKKKEEKWSEKNFARSKQQRKKKTTATLKWLSNPMIVKKWPNAFNQLFITHKILFTHASNRARKLELDSDCARFVRDCFFRLKKKKRSVDT